MSWRSLLDLVSAQPARFVAGFALAHVVVWTLAPAVTHSAAPLDVIEGYAVGTEWVIGTYKHPALPSWLLQITRILTGTTGWPAYLLSALSIAATYGFVFLLGRDLMDERRAAAGTLLLSGIIYFNWVSPEFNHNVIQMPLWAGFAWALWRATERPTMARWLLVAVFAAAGMYGKLSTALLLLAGGAWMLTDERSRRLMRTPGPWLALVTFALLALPLVYWLIATNFLSLEYASRRALDGHASGVGAFVAKQLVSCLAALILLLASGLVFNRRPAASAATTHAAEGTGPIRDRPLRFLLVLLLVPLAVTILSAAALGAGLKASWAAPMLNLIGLVAVALCSSRFDNAAPQPIAAGAMLLLPLIACAYVLNTAWLAPRFGELQRVAWPQAQIAKRFDELWRARTGRPLRIVGGDPWVAGLIAAGLEHPPSVFFDADLEISPWITRQRLYDEGALIVWRHTTKSDPTEYQWLIGERVDGVETIPMARPKRDGPLAISYAIVPPH
ncbi:MAG TPA: glycosyltransferase family 39 protein [Hyphomicrobiaceae bacterium]|nr:glycosyltransferase family 39 protein [Hyphomicrobiaceae bacterium]